MGRVVDYTERLVADLDGSEVTYLSDGGSYKASLTEIGKFVAKVGTSKPVSQGTITAIPTTLPVTPGQRNVYWCNTSGGGFDVTSLGNLGGTLPVGYSVIFRKTTRDTNKVRFGHTSGGVALTKASGAVLHRHYVDDHKEIELVWDGAAWNLISDSDIDYGLDMSGATDSRAAFHSLLVDYAGESLTLPHGRIKLDGAPAGGSYPNGGAVEIPADTKLVGHPLGTEIYCDTPNGGQSYLNLNDGVSITGVNVTMNPTPVPTGNCRLIRAVNVSNIKLTDMVIDGGGTLQDKWGFSLFPMIAYGVSKSKFVDVTFQNSQNTAYGIEIIGCSYLDFLRCNFIDNGADGAKCISSVTYDQNKNFRCSHCRFENNGQRELQLLDGDKAMDTFTKTATFVVAAITNGDRYRLNYTLVGDFTLPASTNTGKYLYVARQSNTSGTPTINAVPTIKVASGTLTGMGASGNTLPIQANITFNFEAVTLKCTEVAGGWALSGDGNGNGFDGEGENHLFTSCQFHGNQSTGAQVKPGTVGYTTSDWLFTGCDADDNGSSGFGIVYNATIETIAPISSIAFNGCSVMRNWAAGIHMNAAGHIHGVSVDGCMIRSNGGGGVNIGKYVRNASVTGCKLLGNHYAVANGTTYNITVDAATNVTISDCYLSGVDPIDQALLTMADIDDTGNRRNVRGIFIRKVNTNTLTNLRIANCSFHNHDNNLHKDYRTAVGAGVHTDSDIDSYTAANLVEIGYPRMKRVMTIPLNEAMVWDSNAQLPDTEAADDLGLTAGTLGDAGEGMHLTAGIVGATSSTRYARFRVVIPTDYEAGQPVKVRLVGLSHTAVCNTTCNADVNLWTSDTAPVRSSDLVTTAATTVNSTNATTVLFTVTSTTLVPGQELDVRVALIWDNGANDARPRITRLQLLY